MTRTGRVMLVFGAIAAVLALAFRQLPSSFLPEEDQGYFMTTFQLPADATAGRTLDVVKAFERHVASRASSPVQHVHRGLRLLGVGLERGDGLHHAERLGRAQRRHGPE